MGLSSSSPLLPTRSGALSPGGGRVEIQQDSLRHLCHSGRHDVHGKHPEPVCHQHRQVSPARAGEGTQATPAGAGSICEAVRLAVCLRVHVFVRTCAGARVSGWGSTGRPPTDGDATRDTQTAAGKEKKALSSDDRGPRSIISYVRDLGQSVPVLTTLFVQKSRMMTPVQSRLQRLAVCVMSSTGHGAEGTQAVLTSPGCTLGAFH